MSLQTHTTPVDRDNYIYMIGDIVNIKSKDTIDRVTINGTPKWRNWTNDGSYDYIYTVVGDVPDPFHIQQSNILGLHS
jgi:hypothetical protein